MTIDPGFDLEVYSFEEIAAAIELLNDAQRVVDEDPVNHWEFLPHQLGPDGPNPKTGLPWRTELYAGGRFAGKTWSVARHFYNHMMDATACSHEFEGGHEGLILGQTLSAVQEACIDPPSGLATIDSRIEVKTRLGGTFVHFPNGATAKMMGVDTKREVEKLRPAGNKCCVWVDELAAIHPLKELLRQLRAVVRIGPRRTWFVSTTPRSRKAYIDLVDRPDTFMRTGSLLDNPHADETLKQDLVQDFEGSRWGRQEIDGELIRTVEGALWSADGIEERRIRLHRLAEQAPQREEETRESWIKRALRLHSVLIGVDPATSGRGDETGIVVAGFTAGQRRQRQGFVLDDATFLSTPDQWRRKVLDMCLKWGTFTVVAEENRLGETVELVIRDFINPWLRDNMPTVPSCRVVRVNAKLSKGQRADPVAAAWQKRCWIVGRHAKLETQMTSWVPAEDDTPDPEADEGEFGGSPDAIDAMVHVMSQGLGFGSQKPGKKSADLSSIVYNNLG